MTSATWDDQDLDRRWTKDQTDDLDQTDDTVTLVDGPGSPMDQGPDEPGGPNATVD